MKKVLWIPTEINGRKTLAELRKDDGSPVFPRKYRVIYPSGIQVRLSPDLKDVDEHKFLPVNTIITDGKPHGVTWIQARRTVLPPDSPSISRESHFFSKYKDSTDDWIVIDDFPKNYPGDPCQPSHPKNRFFHKRARTQEIKSKHLTSGSVAASSRSSLPMPGLVTVTGDPATPVLSSMLKYQSTKGLAERKARRLHTIQWRHSLLQDSTTIESAKEEKDKIRRKGHPGISVGGSNVISAKAAERLHHHIREERRNYLLKCAKYADLLTLRKQDKEKEEDTKGPSTATQTTTKGGEHEIEKDIMQTMVTIRGDVERTYQTIELFRRPTTKSMLIRILVVWSAENKGIGYIQAYSQILSIIFMALHKDLQSLALRQRALQLGSSTNDAASPSQLQEYESRIYGLIDTENLEPDAHSLLDLVMKRLYSHFGGKDTTHSHGSTDTAGLERSMNRIHHKFLKSFDPEIYECLERENVIPQLYLVRWIRLLFAREICIDQVFCLWDHIFYNIDILEYLCVTLVVVMRQKLLTAAREGNIFQQLLQPGFFVNFDSNVLYRHARSLMDKNLWFSVSPRVPGHNNTATTNIRFASGIWNKFISKNAFRRASKITLELQAKAEDDNYGNTSNGGNDDNNDEEEEEEEEEEDYGSDGSEIWHRIVDDGATKPLKERATIPPRRATFVLSDEDEDYLDRNGIPQRFFNYDDMRGITMTRSKSDERHSSTDEFARDSEEIDDEENRRKQEETKRGKGTPAANQPHLLGKSVVLPTRTFRNHIDDDEKGERRVRRRRKKKKKKKKNRARSLDYKDCKLNVHGLLVKRGEGALGRRSYKLRWFVLQNRVLSYYKNKEVWETGTMAPIKNIQLRGSSVKIINPNRFHFVLAPKDIKARQYLLYASDLQAMQLWVSAITSATGAGPASRVGKKMLPEVRAPRLHSQNGSFAVEAPF